MVVAGYIFLAIGWVLIAVLMYKELRVPVKFIYRHTIRSGDWSFQGFLWAIKSALEIYLGN